MGLLPPGCIFLLGLTCCAVGLFRWMVVLIVIFGLFDLCCDSWFGWCFVVIWCGSTHELGGGLRVLGYAYDGWCYGSCVWFGFNCCLGGCSVGGCALRLLFWFA